jgi:asparagine synthase (glutamine-hydrolysing)
MCGLAGWIRVQGGEPAAADAMAEALASSIVRRGPDGRGALIRDGGRIGLVHARLAIIDVAARSDQPLVDEATGAAIAYNGELYNYRELRAELQSQGVAFRTEGDTEVILLGYLNHGPGFFRRMRGMYAFVIHDARTGAMVALRDPLGIKPLYVRRDRGGVFFGSSARGLADAGDSPAERSPEAAVSLALLGCILDPLSLYRGIEMMAPAVLHSWRIGTDQVHETVEAIDPDWRWADPAPRSPEALENALAESVAAHFESDVPVAVFQSSGLDSRLITTLAVKAGHRPHLLTLSFEEFRGTALDEAPAVEAFARGLGLQQTTFRLNFEAFEGLRARFLEDMESPTIDGINTYLIAKLCREAGIKVALSGVGGDELFAGYGSFRRLPALRRFGGLLSAPAIRSVAGLAARRFARGSRVPAKLAYLPDYAADMRQLYLLQRSVFLPQDAALALDPDVLRAGLPGFLEAYHRLTTAPLPAAPSTVRRFERDVYMRNMLLKDADWAGMAHGVEIRTPFVDVALIRALCDEDSECAYTKSDLRALLGRLSGEREGAARKVGFSVPYQLWFAPDPSGRQLTASQGIRRWCQHVIGASFPGWATV